jgi:hypothetical protein
MSEEKVHSSLNLDKDLCYYTLNSGFQLIYQWTILPVDTINIVLEYVNVYRDDHTREYKFTSEPYFIDLIHHLQLPYDNTNRFTVIISGRRIGKTWLLIDFLLNKEIECKEQGKPCSILFMCAYPRDRARITTQHASSRNKLNEPWMNKDNDQITHNYFSTNNKFNISFKTAIDTLNFTSTYDYVLMDEVSFESVGLDRIKPIVKYGKKIIMIHGSDQPLDLNPLDNALDKLIECIHCEWDETLGMPVIQSIVHLKTRQK